MKSSPSADAAPLPGSRLHQEFLASRFLGREVELSILLPGHAAPLAARLPVLYLNDGQDLPRLQLQARLNQLYQRGALRPFVLVAIHANEERVQEYGTAGQPDYQGRGSKAGAYSQFVLEELLPFVQQQYKVSADPAHAVFAGFSLGGLSAFDLVWRHPEAFARAGVFSGSFWWRSRGLAEDYTPADRIMHARVQAGLLHPTHSFWLQTGTLDESNDRDGNGVIDAIDDCLDLVEALVSQGLAVENIRYVQAEGGRHNPETWGRLMPDFLQWAFGAGTAPALPAPLPVVRLKLAQAREDAADDWGAPEPEATPDPDPTPLAGVPHSNHVPAYFSSAEHPNPMALARPAEGDYLPFYQKYISLVPEDADPRQLLREQTRQVQATFSALTEEQAQTAYAPGKWTIKQLLLHQIDTERIFAYRALRFARGDGQALSGFDENEYAENSGANERSLASLLEEYAATRAATLALFDSFTDEQLQRQGAANGAPVTVNALVYILPGHERHHLNIFAERYLPTL